MVLAAVERKTEENEGRRQDAEFRAGVITAAVLNSAGVKKDDGRAWMPWDVFPGLPAPEPEQRTASMLDFVAALNSKLGGKDLRGEKGA